MFAAAKPPLGPRTFQRDDLVVDEAPDGVLGPYPRGRRDHENVRRADHDPSVGIAPGR